MLNRFRELVEINRAIASSLDYEQVLRLVVEKTANFTRADSCALLLAGDDNVARVVASSGIDAARAAQFAVPLDERINTALRDLLGFHQQDDTFLGVPIIHHGRIYGVLVVHRRGPNESDDSEEEFLVTALADQAAIALEHATQYRDVHRLSEHKSRLLETIQSNTTSYLAYLDHELRFIEANAAYCQAIGRAREEVVGKRYVEVSPDRALLPLLESVRDTGAPAELREVTHRPLGNAPQRAQVYWDCSARPVSRLEGGVEGVVVSAIDVTDRVLARRELEDASGRKDEFLAMLAHELRNPLAAISNAVEVLRLHMPEDPVLGRVHNAASRQVWHMKRLLDDLLDVSRITRGMIMLERSVVDIRDVANQAIHSSTPLIQANQHQLSTTLPDGQILVHADPERLVQVISNLLSNAAKFTRPSGRIGLAVHREGDEVEIRVRDNGAGIEPNIQPFIFDLFVQSKRELDRTQGGLGIGLTIVKRLVEMHGGSIDARSQGLGHGSEFVVRLPNASSSEERPQPASDVALRTAGRHIALVEDNVDIAQTLAAALEAAGHQVTVIHDGAHAVELIRTHRPNVVLLDIGLPGMDGYEVARRLQEELGPRMPLLIALTGYGRSEDRRRGEDAGIRHYLVKPVELRQILRLLDEEL